MSLATMMSRQRDARLAKEAEEKAQEQARARRCHEVSAANFWDNIDTSGGPDACHPWTGERRWNHPPDSKWARYEQAVFRGYEGVDTEQAVRVTCFATFGRLPPQDLDVTPICGDHLCMNLRHMALVKHGGCDRERRLNASVPVEEFFRCEAA